MYRQDVATITSHAEANPEGLLDVIEFVLCTIQQPLASVKKQRIDIKAEGLKSRFLKMGKKAEGVQYAYDNAVWLHGRLFHLRDMGPNNPEVIAEAIVELMKVPGLAMVKASFVLQCIGFNVACMDSHNLKRLGLKEGAFKVAATAKKETKIKKALAYIELCQAEGSEYWWDSWCEHVAGNQANRMLKTGDAVSAFHVECIILD